MRNMLSDEPASITGFSKWFGQLRKGQRNSESVERVIWTHIQSGPAASLLSLGVSATTFHVLDLGGEQDFSESQYYSGRRGGMKASR